MSKHSKGAATAAPSKAPRKKPGPSARAKARAERLAQVKSIPSHEAREAAALALARYDNARAEQLEIENAERRQRLNTTGGPQLGYEVKIAEPQLNDAPKKLTLLDAYDAAERCLDYTGDLLALLEKALAPVLRPENPNGSCYGVPPTPEQSDVAGRLRAHCARNADLNARLQDLLGRLDLPTP